MISRVLILGGTAEARAIAADLVEAGIAVTSSLAGRVSRPRLPVGDVRVGGFGGPHALAAWLQDNGIVAVLDATHPFAERISRSAASASSRVGVPLLRVARPGWTAAPGDRWRWVSDLDEAAAAIHAGGPQRVFLTTGRQGLGAFTTDTTSWFLIRCVDPPGAVLPERHLVLIDRGPYALAGELALLDTHRIDVVVTKDSGGQLTRAKLDSARARGLPVVIVRRPARTPGRAVETIAEATAWARAQVARRAE